MKVHDDLLQLITRARITPQAVKQVLAQFEKGGVFTLRELWELDVSGLTHPPFELPLSVAYSLFRELDRLPTPQTPQPSPAPEPPEPPSKPVAKDTRPVPVSPAVTTTPVPARQLTEKEERRQRQRMARAPLPYQDDPFACVLPSSDPAYDPWYPEDG